MKRRRITAALVVILLLGGAFFFLRASGRPEPPIQPIAFDHWQHVSKPEADGGPQLDCAFCHEHADKSAHASIPNVDTCMLCHQATKAESPEVQKLAGFAERGEQPPWRRVYWYEREAAVFFSHKPHTRAGVECAACHGDVANSRVVRREIEQTMGWCIDCHQQRGASIDCYACHR
jgi:hypothetical protein